MRKDRMTKKELAKELRVSEAKINKDLEKGLPKTRLGRALRFDLDDVMKWYKEKEVE